jgi:isopropylmalate/homocitrate/citramalate synthase
VLAGTSVALVDVTLRDGMQAANVALTSAQRLEVALLLEEAGVDIIQAGFAGRDDASAAAIRQRVDKPRVSLLLLGFDPLAEEQLDGAAEAGVDVIEILVRSGTRQLESMGLDARKATELSTHLTSSAIDRFPEVWFCPSFATQANPDTLTEMLDAVAETGVRHFTIPDSCGVAAPADIASLIGRFAHKGWDLGIHCHDDFGLGLANTLAGIAAGARYADVTVNGYGERAGNCSFEQLATALAQLFGATTSVDLSTLHGLAHGVASLVGRSIAPDAAVVGRDVFAQKLDAHVRLTDRDPSLLEPFDPAIVGNARRLAVGPGSGEYSLSRKLQSLGVQAPDPRAVALALPTIIQLVEEEKDVPDDVIVLTYTNASRELSASRSR